MKNIILITLMSLTFTSCEFLNFKEKSNSNFADQHFKTAIANIELYKIRHGYYPANFEAIDFLGEWDKLIIKTVEYEKLENGYRLDIIEGIVKGTPTDLKYPKEFWQGLGITKSNLLNNNK